MLFENVVLKRASKMQMQWKTPVYTLTRVCLQLLSFTRHWKSVSVGAVISWWRQSPSYSHPVLLYEAFHLLPLPLPPPLPSPPFSSPFFLLACLLPVCLFLKNSELFYQRWPNSKKHFICQRLFVVVVVFVFVFLKTVSQFYPGILTDVWRLF